MSKFIYRPDGQTWAKSDAFMDELRALREDAAPVERGAYEPDGFQAQCLRTWRAEGQTHQQQVMHAAFGLGGEAGEVLDLLKKHFFKPGRTATAEMVMDELADVLYYAAVLAHLWGVTFEDMQAHLAGKLADGHGWVEDAAEAADNTGWRPVAGSGSES